MSKNDRYLELIRLFSKLGVVSFGGPAAHTALMRREVVEKRKWISEQHFLDLIGATNLIPGPNSTEMAIHIGHERAGWKGSVISGLCFILPAVIITGLFAWLYKEYGHLPKLQPFIYGIKPAIIAIILSAIYPLARKSLKSIEIYIIGAIILILAVCQFNEIYLMFGAGLFSMGLFLVRTRLFRKDVKSIYPFILLQVNSATLLKVTNFKLFLSFLKIGAILYGSGYVLFAFLDAELVSKGILTRPQLIDAIAVGQFTPGPLFSSVTFIGYQINGWTGAAVATIGIFLPSFVFVALLNPMIKIIRNSKLFSAFLDSVNVASIAIIMAVCYEMGKETATDWRSITIAIMSLMITFGFRKVNSAFIVLFGVVAGYILYLV